MSFNVFEGSMITTNVGVNDSKIKSMHYCNQ